MFILFMLVVECNDKTTEQSEEGQNDHDTKVYPGKKLEVINYTGLSS